jgi:regulator of replication initiation timing
MQQITQDDLIQYLYNEAPPALKQAVEKELEQNWSLQEELQNLQHVIQGIESIPAATPRQQTIDAIMNYARATDAVTHQ